MAPAGATDNLIGRLLRTLSSRYAGSVIDRRTTLSTF
jgi:hypothetical protein